ncbi:DUF2924 domain-containing protein [Kordiimonas lipolytica]|uniref:DUF2924 domain-containing protein n=1 Tax=Kordiimonas lipolytica TaxID=1662421 RepID=A0ABV8UER1_9PROT|nr:DUF2924 domain-containing protein [Kordiimonas lipolytica]
MTARTARRPKHSSVPNGNRGTAESAAKVATGLAALPSLSHAELKSQWVETFGAAVPKGLSHRLMIYALAYEVQKLGSGGLKSAVRQELRQVADPSSSKASTDSLQLTPGTRLMREWRGTVHVVDVTEDGLVWNGRVYASLSAIARTITGTRWSGNRFFGLRKRSDAVDAYNPARAKPPTPNSSAKRPASRSPNNSSVNAPAYPELLTEDAKTDAMPHPEPDPTP